MWGNLELLIPLLWLEGILPKSLLILDYHMKLSHCYADVTAIALGADLGPCQTTRTKLLAKYVFAL